MEKLLERVCPQTKHLSVHPEDLQKIYREPLPPLKPQPPQYIKTKSLGFFTSSTEYIYNFECPLYKKDLSRYEKGSKIYNKVSKNIHFMGPYGVVELISDPNAERL